MNELIGTKEIAQFLGITRAHCVGRIIKRVDFPTPALNVSQRLRKWKKSDIMKWAGFKS